MFKRLFKSTKFKISALIVIAGTTIGIWAYKAPNSTKVTGGASVNGDTIARVDSTKDTIRHE